SNIHSRIIVRRASCSGFIFQAPLDELKAPGGRPTEAQPALLAKMPPSPRVLPARLPCLRRGGSCAGSCLLTDPRRFDFLQSGPGWRGLNAMRSIEAP